MVPSPSLSLDTDSRDKANQGYAVSVSLEITSIIYATSFVGKGSPAG
jgi:hypothetical protein